MKQRGKGFILCVCCVLGSLQLFSQNYPWENPLRSAWSNDGVSFSPSSIFQDSAGVPSLVRWKGDTLVCAFQWFRIPVGSPTWDRVAVKFSYDNGLTWTQPQAILVNGLPVNYQRPFDPALLVIGPDSLRIYFSSSDGIPNGLDSTVNTYSASGTDGINYQFEPGARVDEPNNRVIDPAVIRFNSAIHYAAPAGSPQQGAYHYISPNGINFMKVQDIPSDPNHNWTGNYMVNDSSELRFYGAGMGGIWYNSSPNGGVWNGYTSTNLQGGDPAVLRTGINNYLIVFVGMPYTAGLAGPEPLHGIRLFPNPTSGKVTLALQHREQQQFMTITEITGRFVTSVEIVAPNQNIDLSGLNDGMYFLTIDGQTQILVIRK